MFTGVVQTVVCREGQTVRRPRGRHPRGEHQIYGRMDPRQPQVPGARVGEQRVPALGRHHNQYVL